MVISEARLAAGAKGLIWGIVAASVMVIVISAQAGTGLLLAAGIVVLTWLIVPMTVSIAVTEESIVVRCEPFYLTEIPISDVLAVTTARVTSFSEGYGIRAMGKNTRGVLVGGPAVALETASRRWIISATHPEEAVSTIRDRLAGKC